MIYKNILENQFLVRNAVAEDPDQIEYVQSQCYPTLRDSEILNKNYFANHIKLFSE